MAPSHVRLRPAPRPRLRSIPTGSEADQRARYSRSLGPCPGRDPKYDYDPTSGPLAELFTTIADIIDLGVPTGTLKVDHLAWGRWCEFCLEMKTSPWRTDQPANSGADPAGFQREAKLLCAFLLWVYNRIQPRSKADPAPKPESAYNMVCAVRRVHRRNNISMVSCTQLSAVLKGLTASFIIEHGAEALLPTRRQPLGPHLLRQLLGGVPATQTGQRLGSQRLDWAAPLFQSLGAMFALAGSTGFRKAEVALPSGCAFDDRRLSRASVLWRINGVVYADPPPALLEALVPRRDYAVIKPPRSKADQDGTKFGALPIYLIFDPSDPINAPSWLQRLELRLPCHGSDRKSRPLFTEDHLGRAPMSHATVDRLLGLLLRAFLPEDEAKVYSFHSFRVGFACALLAAGCDPATIQALARWRSTESLAIYARLNPADYAAWVSKALSQTTDSITTRRLPRLPLLDEFDLMATFATADAIFTRVQR
jgi:hypothetical protein